MGERGHLYHDIQHDVRSESVKVDVHLEVTGGVIREMPTYRCKVPAQYIEVGNPVPHSKKPEHVGAYPEVELYCRMIR